MQNVQSADAEHHADSDLLLPVQVEALELRQGNRQHPKVDDDADCGIGETNNVDVGALPLVLAVPLCPEIADGLALEDGDDDEDGGEEGVEDDGSPEQLAHPLGREDAQVEEQQRGLQQRDLRKVQDRHDVEVHAKLCDLVEWDRPDVAPQPVGHGAVYVDGLARRRADARDQDEPVIEAEGDLQVDLEDEALDDQEAGDDCEGVAEHDVFARLVSDGGAAVRHG